MLENLVKFFGCGVTYQVSNEATCFVVSKLEDNLNIIVPFFYKYPLRGFKLADYLDFKASISMMVRKEHLTIEGLSKFLLIKSGMNRGRKID